MLSHVIASPLTCSEHAARFGDNKAAQWVRDSRVRRYVITIIAQGLAFYQSKASVPMAPPLSAIHLSREAASPMQGARGGQDAYEVGQNSVVLVALAALLLAQHPA